MTNTGNGERQVLPKQVKSKRTFERLESNFGLERTLNADDMLNFFDGEHLKTKQILAALGVNQNRYTQITKEDVDGSQMRYEPLSAPLEVYLRLLFVFPEAKPWDIATPEMVIEKCGYKPEELSDICCNNEATGERWATFYKEGKEIKVSGYSMMIVDTLYRIHRMGAPKELVTAIIEKIRRLRVESEFSFDEEDAAFELASSWQLPTEKKAKAIRKELKSILDSLEISDFAISQDSGNDQKASKIRVSQTKYITQLITSSSNDNELAYSQLIQDSTLEDFEAEPLVNNIRLCIDWFRAKNERQFFYSSLQTVVELEEIGVNIDEIFGELLALKSTDSLQVLLQHKLSESGVEQHTVRYAERILNVLEWYREERARVLPYNLGDLVTVLRTQMLDRVSLMKMFEKTIGIIS